MIFTVKSLLFFSNKIYCTLVDFQVPTQINSSVFQLRDLNLTCVLKWALKVITSYK